MHVLFITFDRNTLLKIIFTVLISALGLLHLIKNFAFKYSEIHTNFNKMTLDQPCFVCGNPSNKQCSRCKSVRYCSQECQSKDWRSGHKNNCKKIACSNKSKSTSLTEGLKGSFGRSTSAGIFPVPANGGSEVIKTKKVLYPYDEFVMLFNLDMPGFPPCGLLNCGNSCFANVVLQCLSFTRPLTAYLLKKGHRITCKRNDWCFLCEFQDHVESVSRNCQPFSPINIFSRLSNIGGNFGCGSQEDAHEFMRFAIDTMQSNCLDEFGGERTVHHNSQETTLIQHIFGGQLQSQVNCSLCNKESDLFENIMDLTVEIHDASTLEESLHQFTDKEWLYGDNMYKCDRCNDYVKAWKRLTIQTPPNILTIALKRFQSGTFGKLNKKVTFPETLDLSPYMSEAGDGTDVYKLYAVVVHLDMLNVSSFGHYICYAKDFHGNWYLIDDYKVKPVSLEEVLSQKAYMLLYSRVSARPSCLKAAEHLEIEKEKVTVEPCSRKQNGSFAPDPPCSFLSSCEGELSIADYFEPTRGLGHPDVDIPSSNLSLSQESFEYEYVSSSATSSDIFSDMNEEDTPMSSSPILKEIPRQEEELSILNNVGTAKRAKQMTVADPASLSVACYSEEEPGAMGEKSENADLIKSKLSAVSTNNLKVCSNGHDTMDCDGSLREAQDIVPSSFHSSDETSERRITSYS